jgi:Domain of unknown function (DUF4124)
VKTGPVVIALVLVLAAGLTAGADSAWAQRSGGGGRGAFAGGGGGRAFVGGIPPALINGGVGGGPRAFGTLPGPRPAFVNRPGFGPGFHHHRFFRPFFPFGIVAAAPSVVYAAPYYYPPSAYYPPPYYDPPVYSAPMNYSPPVSYAPAPDSTVSVAPTPNAVQFSTGRYELRGDGVSTPYTWVWIPNPPTSPPPLPPPAAEPGVSGGASSGPAPARVGQLYRWTDKDGVVHWTDRIDAVPEQYRQRVRTTPS